jgi:hypothetical protein
MLAFRSQSLNVVTNVDLKKIQNGNVRVCVCNTERKREGKRKRQINRKRERRINRKIGREG